MLADPGTTTPLLPESQAPVASRGAKQLRPRIAARVLAFAGAIGLVLVYGLRGGGSYDVVAFEQQGLVIWFVLAVGIALGLLPRRRPSPAVLVLLALAIVYAVWTAFSLLWTQSSELTTAELARSLDYVGLVALAACLLERQTWRAAAAGLGLGSLLVCLIALGSRLAPSVFGVDHVDAVLHADRLAFPFGYWNAVAAWGAMSTAVGLIWSAHDPSRFRRGIALALVPAAATVTYLTYSRAGIAGTALAIVLAVALSRNRITVIVHGVVAAVGAALAILAIRGAPQIAHATGTAGAGGVLGALVFGAALAGGIAVLTRRTGVDSWRTPSRLRRPLAIAVAIAVVVPLAAVGPREASRAWRSFKRTPNATVSATANTTTRLTSLSSTRYVVWKTAIKAFDAHPADGTGAGTFEFWWNEHGTDPEFVRDAHNIWLENMAELGLPGLLLVAAIAAAALWLAIAVRLHARRAISAGPAAAFLAAWIVYLFHASVDWMWESTAVTVLALAGVAVLGARLSRRPLRLALWARVGLVAAAAAVSIIQLPGILSTGDVRRSQSAELAGDPPAAVSLARDAVSAEPWSASAHEQEALVLEAAGRLQQAAHQESLAISDEPENYAHWLIRARIEAELGQLAPAALDYARAHQLRPWAVVFALAPVYEVK